MELTGPLVEQEAIAVIDNGFKILGIARQEV
jgi:hypothetical protein